MGIFSKLFGKAEDKAPEVHEDIKIFTDILDRGDGVNDVYVAGLAHYCTRKDVGFFAGVVFNEKDNPYDRKAMAIGDTQKKKIIGYIPAAILSEYRKWCKDKHVCVGYIFYDGEQLRGRIRAYLPDVDKDKMVKDMSEYAKIACEHFGWEAPNFTWE